MDNRLRRGFREPKLVQAKVRQIKNLVTRPWAIMEICGGQTHAIKKFGIDQLLPPEIEFIHGPGCPVCVTSLELVDKALQIASMPNVIFTSYGDMLRVPGSKGDLFGVKANGGDVRVIYSPLDSLKIAQENPEKEVVFFAIGFETTAPANAMCVLQAQMLGIDNFSMLVSHFCVPPAVRAILSSPSNRVQGFLAAGHVCTVMGYWEYLPIAQEFHVPIVVTGFEPLDILEGVYRVVQQLEKGTYNVENAYSRLVTYEGNVQAQRVIHQVFEVCDRKWRGIGVIPHSGWKLRKEFAKFDAECRFNIESITAQESSICISGLILQGLKKPYECTAFGTLCTPQNPLGATMVSSEGACAAYYQYSRNDEVSKISHV